MKIYRCVIGCLLVFFIVVGVWYVVSCYNERGSIDDGTLIWESSGEYDRLNQSMRGEIENVTDHGLC